MSFEVPGLPGGMIPGSAVQVRSYVQGADHLRYQQLAQGTVQVYATHSNLRQLVQDLRLDLHSTIAAVKARLFTHNGTAMSAMELHLKDREGNTLCRMLDDDRMLGFYGCQNGFTIHVVDTDPMSLSRDGGLDDVSGVQKYRMSEEEYDARENTYRNFVRKQREKDPSWRPVHATGAGVIAGAGAAAAGGGGAASSAEFLDAACAAHVAVGERCSVSPGDRRGVAAFVGPVKGLAPGFWVGVRLDEPRGKNDGSYKGVSYFEAGGPSSGLFARPPKVVRMRPRRTKRICAAAKRIKRSPRCPLPPRRRAAIFRRRALTTRTRRRARAAPPGATTSFSLRSSACTADDFPAEHITSAAAASRLSAAAAAAACAAPRPSVAHAPRSAPALHATAVTPPSSSTFP